MQMARGEALTARRATLRSWASLAAYPGMMRRDRQRLRLRECRAAWLLGLTVREYRALEAGDATVTPDVWERMVEVFGWPQSLVVGGLATRKPGG